MEHLDLRKMWKHLYQPSAKKVALVEVPRFQFAMIDGEIETGQSPGSSQGFGEAMQALYGIAYTLKFICKLRKENPIDYPVMALEGLWWVSQGEFNIRVKDNWAYTVMIMQPDLITPELFQEGLQQLRKKKGDQPAFSRLRLEAFEEGLCVQIMHLGPYDAEPATIEKMDAFALENGYRMCGKHHEIYLGDPRRGDSVKLKTILRHPVVQG
ncbi:MAG: GyrI-like domain-containing protein [Anaerolineales bacterium]|nr:GyrI-like domain-containing protein [Anaerolineales bacterium]